MENMRVPLYQSVATAGDIEAVSSRLRCRFNWADGPSVRQFEEELSDYVGSDYCVAFNSGTTALQASLMAIGGAKMGRVAVPPFTFIATANSVLMSGGTHRFIDIEAESFGVDPARFEEERTNLAGIVPVHIGGAACKIEEIARIARKRGMFVVEDCAESLGTFVGNRHVGTFGDIGVFSFCANKIVTTGDGGAAVTDSESLYRRLMLIRSHGRRSSGDSLHMRELAEYVALGSNYRMSDILAELACSQLRRIESLVKHRRRAAGIYNRLLKNLDGIHLLHPLDGVRHVYQLFSIWVNETDGRNSLMRYLLSKGVGTKVYFPPIHLTRYYRGRFGYRSGRFPNSELAYHHLVSLPMFEGIDKEQIEYVCRCVHDYLSR